MSDNVQELRQRILKMEHNMNFLVKTVSALAKNVKPSKWMDEVEVCELLGTKDKPMSKRQIAILRKEGVIMGYSSTGKNFKYLRSEVDEFIEGKKGNEMLQVSQKYYRSKKQQVHN